MLSKILSGTVIGLDGVLIEVEVDVASGGFPTFTIVGLPNKSVDEAKDRVRTAVINSSYEMPDSRITVNLAPADIPKIGAGFDLPIALGILASSGIIPNTAFYENIFIGELSLQGEVRSVPGMISIAFMAKEKGIQNLFVPKENAPEIAFIEGIHIYPADTLTDIVLHVTGKKMLAVQPFIPIEDSRVEVESFSDFSTIRGQVQAKRAMEIAAAGFHNIHLTGPPGTGKTLLSRSFSSILPPLDSDEMIEVSRIYSAAGLLQGKSLIVQRPFRAPHHTTSRIGLIGGGSHPGPGEISLAHRGVLFLDELSEFPRSVLESLRQPLEDGFISISRALGSLMFPSRFLLLGASNPCPCGYLGHHKKNCVCLPYAIIKYRKKISGPLADRIELHIHVPAVEEDRLVSSIPAESSETIRKRVIEARDRQKRRFRNGKIKTNSEMSSAEVQKFCHLNEEAKILLKQAIHKFALSARSYYKIIKVAQTIADLEGQEGINNRFISEALQYRIKEE